MGPTTRNSTTHASLMQPALCCACSACTACCAVPPSHPQQVADHHRVGHHDEGLGAKLQLEHTAIVNEPAAMPTLELELRGMCPSEASRPVPRAVRPQGCHWPGALHSRSPCNTARQQLNSGSIACL